MPLFWGRGWINNKGTHANNFEAGQDLLQYTLVVETAVGSNIVIEAPNQNDAIGFVISPKGAVLGARVDVLLFEEFHLDEGGSGGGELITDFTFDELTNLLTIETDVPATWQVDLSSLAGGGGGGDTITDFTLVGSNLEIVTDQATWNVNLATLFDENGIEVKVATTAVLPGSPTYNNGASGVGATLTRVGGTIGLIDGYAPVVGDLILVKNQAAQLQNGVYEVTSLTGGYVLTRTTNSDETVEFDDQIVLVNTGNTQAGTVWAQQTANPTVGTNNIVYVQSSVGGVKQQTSGTQVLFQIPWWVTAPKTLSKGNQDFTFSGSTTREFSVKNLGNTTLLISPSSGIYMMGDTANTAFGTWFGALDSAKQLTGYAGNFDGASGPGEFPQFFSLDGSNNTASFGGIDAGFGNNATNISIDGQAHQVNFSSTQNTFGGYTKLFIDGNFFATQDPVNVNLFIGTLPTTLSFGGGVLDWIVGLNSGIAITNSTGTLIAGNNSCQTLTSGSIVSVGYGTANDHTTGVNTLNFGNGNLTGNANNSAFIGNIHSCAGGDGHLWVGNNIFSLSSFNYTIAYGRSAHVTASRQWVVGNKDGIVDSYISDAYFGAGFQTNAVASVDFTLHGSGASGTNTAAANFIFAAQSSTGNAVPGSLKWQTGTVGASGSTLQTQADRLILDGSTGGFRVLFDHGTADTLWGRDSTNGGLVALTLGTNLSISAGALNATGGGGGFITSVTDTSTIDLTVTGTDLTADVINSSITYAKIQNSSVGLTVLGRSANSSGVFAEIAATAASGGVLRESGSTIGFGTIATAGISNSAVTYGKMQSMSASTILGNPTGGIAAPSEITLGTGLSFTLSVLNVTGFASSSLTSKHIYVGSAGGVATDVAVSGDVTIDNAGAITIANDAVTFAKFQNITTARLLGRATLGSGDMEEITLGTGLSFSGTTLNATAAPVVFVDNVFRIQDNGDATKQLAWEVSGITTGTTRTITALNISGTDVLSNGALTNTRIPFWSASGLVDDADLTFATDTLTATIYAVTTRIEPVSNDGAPLGSTTKQFSDLFLAEGGVINWDNGDATLTQAGDVVTLAGADLKVTTPGNAATSVLTTNGTQTVTEKRITKRTGTTASSATPTINTDNVDFYSITALAANITSFTTNLSGTPTEAQTLWIAITDNGTARTIAWGASFEASGSVALPTTTVISTRLDVGFVWNTVTSKWRCVAVA